MKEQKYIGIDLGGTSIKMGLVDQKGSLLYTLESPTPENKEFYSVINTFDGMVDRLLQENGLEWKEITGIGVGAPAFFDLKKGEVVEAVNLGWHHVPLMETLMERWKLPVCVDNDANVAALGEMWVGAGIGATHILCITIGTGIGGGVIINGDIYHGANGSAGEVGHVTVRHQDGRLCNCGKTGCLETEASATAIVLDAMDKLKHLSDGPLKEAYDKSGTLTAKMVVELALKGEPTCKEIIQKAGKVLGRSLAEMCYLLNPELIIIGGGISYAGEMLFNPLTEAFYQTAFPRVAEDTSIVPARLGNQAGMIGAARLVHVRVNH
ncbi:ROK family glucokinase [Microaerobacter geothermalis]|uniref:ROK family glucokinase n=1 Tax=Microaerobacter geothermalis TaxID=674972 RepID=UPI001F410DDF|nr:ROK family glucokinase [Microaerobacter geothermalis]MCF6094276.1 ROK family glucokinase [Microaerobacter geothermalis]